MKTIIYYLLLLVFIAIVSGYLISSGHASSMSMPQMFSISALLVLYVIGMSLAGEGPVSDEREQMHRYYSNRAALIAGTVIISLGILYQLFTHQLDYWLLISLVVINFTKIISLIFVSYKR